MQIALHCVSILKWARFFVYIEESNSEEIEKLFFETTFQKVIYFNIQSTAGKLRGIVDICS